MYRVSIKANPEHFLDWDKPLKEQPQRVRDAFVSALPDTPTVAAWKTNGVLDEAPIGSLVKGLGFSEGPAEISRRLSEAGVPGIKYLDQRSRAEGNGTRNFVVFDDKDVEITHKNGEPVKREEFGPLRQVGRKAPRGRAAADPATWSLFEMLAHEGGLKPDPELEAIFGTRKGPFVPGFGSLVRPTGRTLDDGLRLAKDHGYLFDPADVTGAEGRLTLNDLLDRLAEESTGRRQYRYDQQFATKGEDAIAADREKHEIIRNLHDELEEVSGQPHGAH